LAAGGQQAEAADQRQSYRESLFHLFKFSLYVLSRGRFRPASWRIMSPCKMKKPRCVKSG
uniref:hypothetical protein n=1 Tax=Candidatus Scatomorpha intestinigallinarum TaxID=2840923 RepID=UPI0040277948